MMQNHNVKINPLGVKNSAYRPIRPESVEKPAHWKTILKKQSQFTPKGVEPNSVIDWMKRIDYYGTW
jgi:hypothetical protein